MKASALSVDHTACCATVGPLQSSFQGPRLLSCQTFTICGYKKDSIFALKSSHSEFTQHMGQRSGPGGHQATLQRTPAVSSPLSWGCSCEAALLYWLLPGMSVWYLFSVLWETARKLGKNILWVLIADQLGQLIVQLNFHDWVDTHFNIYLKKCFQIPNCSMETEIILFRISISQSTRPPGRCWETS